MASVAADQREWGALYRAYHPLVHHQCRRFLATSVAADDATQEIFVKLIGNASQVPRGEGTAPWMHRVTANHCLNQLRNERRRRDAGALDEPSAMASDHVANATWSVVCSLVCPCT